MREIARRSGGDPVRLLLRRSLEWFGIDDWYCNQWDKGLDKRTFFSLDFYSFLLTIVALVRS